jgi:hypothetical protein
MLFLMFSVLLYYSLQLAFGGEWFYIFVMMKDLRRLQAFVFLSSFLLANSFFVLEELFLFGICLCNDQVC